MADIAIRVENLSKQYRIGGPKPHYRYRMIREALAEAVQAPVRRLSAVLQGVPPVISHETIWALKDVSFEVERGEVVGIIGRNGAGKSTLLKILSRITDPTRGRVRLRGRVGSLLEVGTGFHPELTGRENIYLNGAILGMKRAEIERKFDEIVGFAEIEKFIYTPVKRYSSGMYVRLAFAVAAHMEPEILFVDEVLAVGDAGFQKKCLWKMKEVSEEGRTILFVSHNMQAISTLTDRSVLLSAGHKVADGPTAGVISTYLSDGGADEDAYVAAPSHDMPKVTRVEVMTSDLAKVQRNGQPMEVVVDISTPVAVRGASISFQACNELDQPLLHLWSFDSDRPMCREPGRYRLLCRIPKLRLYLGRYTLRVHFSESGVGGRKFETIESICPFEVVMYSQYREFSWVPGTSAYLEDCEWRVEKVSEG